MGGKEEKTSNPRDILSQAEGKRDLFKLRLAWDNGNSDLEARADEAYSRIEETTRDSVVRPYGDHETEPETQADEDKSSGVHFSVRRGLCGRLGTSESEPKEHGSADEFAEHG